MRQIWIEILVVTAEVVLSRQTERVVGELAGRHVAELREHEVGHLVVRIENEHERALIRLLGIHARDKIVLRKDVLFAVGQLGERAYAAYHAAVRGVFLYVAEHSRINGAYAGYGYTGAFDLVSVDIGRTLFGIFVIGIDIVREVRTVVITHRLVILFGHILDVLHVLFGYIVRYLRAAELGERFHYAVDVDLIILVPRFVLVFKQARRKAEQRRVVYRVLRHIQRIPGQHVVLHAVYVPRDARGERQHYRHADDTYRARDAHHDRPALFGDEVAPGQRERRAQTHLGAFFGVRISLALRARFGAVRRGLPDAFFRAFVVRVGVADYHAVVEFYDTRGVFLRKLGVVRDHDDETLARDLLHKVHYLHAGHRVESARGFVGKEYLGIVYESARDSHPLALSARELIGFFIQLVAQPHFRERFGCPAAALRIAHARYRESELDVAEHRLVRDEVVALEHEAHAVIAVHVPIAVGERTGAPAVDDKVARGVFIQPADDVEQRRLAAAARAEDGDELAAPELHAHAAKRVDGVPRRRIILHYVYKS